MNFKLMLWKTPKNENKSIKKLKEEAKNELEQNKVDCTSNSAERRNIYANT